MKLISFNRQDENPVLEEAGEGKTAAKELGIMSLDKSLTYGLSTTTPKSFCGTQE